MAWYVIDNFVQRVLEFKTEREMRAYSRKVGWKLHKSPFTEHWFWFDNAF